MRGPPPGYRRESLAFITGELQVHVARGENAKFSRFDDPERFVVVPNQQKPLSNLGQQLAGVRVVFLTQTAGGRLVTRSTASTSFRRRSVPRSPSSNGRNSPLFTMRASLPTAVGVCCSAIDFRHQAGGDC